MPVKEMLIEYYHAIRKMGAGLTMMPKVLVFPSQFVHELEIGGGSLVAQVNWNWNYTDMHRF